MSNQFSIQAGLPIRDPGDRTVPFRSTPPAQEESAKPIPLFVNPSFQFDPTVGLVVIKFHNGDGKVTSSIPSQRQLAAYRTHQASPTGEHAPDAPKTPQPAHGKTSAG